MLWIQDVGRAVGKKNIVSPEACVRHLKNFPVPHNYYSVNNK